MSYPTVSVVVPTVGRPALSQLLATIAAQLTPTAAEILVVDNAPEPISPVIVPHQARAITRVIRQPTPGAAAARECGRGSARGEIIVFVDDDVLPNPGCLDALLEPILSRRCEATGGRVELDPSVPLPRWLQPPLLGYLARYDRGTEERELETDDYSLTAIFAARSDSLAAIGGFDPALGPRPGAHITNDDVQLCRSLHKIGARIRYVPGAHVVHELPPSRLRRRYVISRAYWQGCSDWLLDRGDLKGRWDRGMFRAIPQLISGVVANMRRVGHDPGTPTRIATEFARAAGWVMTAGRSQLDRRSQIEPGAV